MRDSLIVILSCALAYILILPILLSSSGRKRGHPLHLRPWQLVDAYALGQDGEDRREYWTFAGARRAAQRIRGARIVNLNDLCYRTRGRKWSERRNGYLGEYVGAFDVWLLLQLTWVPGVTPEGIHFVLADRVSAGMVRMTEDDGGERIYHATDILRHSADIGPSLWPDNCIVACG